MARWINWKLVEELEVGSLMLSVEVEMIWDVCLRDSEVEFYGFGGFRVVDGYDEAGNEVAQEVLRSLDKSAIRAALEAQVDTDDCEEAWDALEDAQENGVYSGSRLVRFAD